MPIGQLLMDPGSVSQDGLYGDDEADFSSWSSDPAFASSPTEAEMDAYQSASESTDNPYSTFPSQTVLPVPNSSSSSTSGGFAFSPFAPTFTPSGSGFAPASSAPPPRHNHSRGGGGRHHVHDHHQAYQPFEPMPVVKIHNLRTTVKLPSVLLVRAVYLLFPALPADTGISLILPGTS
jgi:hypothetical protein